MFEKEKEIQILCDRLQRTEMELATLKLEKLGAGTQQTASQSTCTETMEHVVGAQSVGLFGQDNKPLITTPPVWSAGLVGQSVAQSGTATTTIYTQSTLPRVLLSIQLGREYHYGSSNQVEIPGNSRVKSNIQSQLGEQVTSVSTTLSGPFLANRSVSSAGVAMTGTVVMAASLCDNWSQCHHGKIPPFDEFTSETAELLMMPILQRAATWNGWTQDDELLMQLAG